LELRQRQIKELATFSAKRDVEKVRMIMEADKNICLTNEDEKRPLKVKNAEMFMKDKK
jgi:exonuclease III